MALSDGLQKDEGQVSGSLVPTSQWDIIHKTVEGEQQWLPFSLLGTCGILVLMPEEAELWYCVHRA